MPEVLEPQPNPNRIKCLKCGELFNSVDRKRNRICPICNRKNNQESSMTPSHIKASNRPFLPE